MVIEHPDFSVVVKNKAHPPKSWRWEIYRAGRTSPIEHSRVQFESMAEASRAGNVALRLLLSDFPDRRQAGRRTGRSGLARGKNGLDH
jgi:hypothetical protein